MDLVILTDEDGGIPVLVALGEVDGGTVKALSERLSCALDEMPTALMLDLSGLRFMDSTGVHAVMDAEQVMQAYGGRLAVVARAEHVRRVFTLTGAPITIPVLTERAEAARALRASLLEWS